MKTQRNTYTEKLAKLKSLAFLQGGEYERKVVYREAVLNHFKKILKDFPSELKPDDGNGDDDSYNRGFNAAREVIGNLLVDKINEQAPKELSTNG